MKSLLRAAFVLMAPLYADLACAQYSAIPEIIAARDGRPAWVSARHALDESGRLKADLVDSPSLRANARLNRKHRAARTTEATTQECRTFLGTYLEHFKSTNSLRDTAAGAEVIVSGRVSSIQEGFLHNLPGSLLRLSGRAIKGTATEEIFLFYPFARIRTADGLVCARPVGEFQPPSVGDHLIIFSMNPALVTGDRMILHVDPAREIIHQGAAGRRVVPLTFARELGSGLTVDQLERRVALEAKSEQRSK